MPLWSIRSFQSVQPAAMLRASPGTGPEPPGASVRVMPGTRPLLPPPPQAPRIPVLRELHGTAEVDGYAWMRDPQQPALRDYLAAERAYYEARSRPLAELAGELFRAAAGRTASRVQDS